MQDVVIQLTAESTGDVVATGAANGTSWSHSVAADKVDVVQSALDHLLDGFQADRRPLADPVGLAQLGTLLRDTYLAPLAEDGHSGRIASRRRFAAY